jgi:hypothetical protein
MSEDRFDELGIPRRGFLKKTAAAAFVAPVVVSFGLDGIAEADTGSFSNQTCGNQAFPNQADQHITQAINSVEGALFFGQIDNKGVAKSLVHKLENAEAYIASGDFSDACGLLASVQSELLAQMGKHVDVEAAQKIGQQVIGRRLAGDRGAARRSSNPPSLERQFRRAPEYRARRSAGRVDPVHRRRRAAGSHRPRNG